MTQEQISTLNVNTYLVPSNCPISSAIRVIEVNDKGIRVRRCHSYWNGEEFFMARNMLETSHWELVPINAQLPLL